MKKALLFVLKTGLFIFFVYNTGIFSYLSNMEKTPPPPRKTDRGRADIDWLNEKYERALQLGAQYGPEQYFADLAEIHLKQNQNDFDYNVSISLQGFISNLNTRFSDNFYRIRMVSHDYEVNAYLSRIRNSQAKYDELVNPGSTAKQAAQRERVNAKGYWLNIFFTFLAWIFKQYLKNFLSAFILLWIWWYQEQEVVKINNPLSFLVCLLLYPIVIIRTWAMRLNENTKYLVMTIEYRRRSKNLFALFSDNELTELKSAVKTKISLTDFRLSLEQRGLTINHALLPALVVSLLLISLPNKSISRQNTGSDSNCKQIKLLQNAPPSTSVNFSADYDFANFDLIIVKADTSPFIIEKMINYLVDYTEKCLNGHRKQLKPIPIFINN